MQGKKATQNKDGVRQYIHDNQKRVNNPPVGLVTAETDHLNGKMTYQFDPHLDPQLQWAGKVEGTDFDVDTDSLHVHERIDPLTIIEAVRKKELQEQQSLFHYFETPEENLPIREAIEFYKHPHGWSNRLIAGDSLIVMNSLLEKEGMAGKVQMIYIDPPYGIKYGSNFQPFVNKRDVKDGKDEDLTQEPEMIKAFRDTWELGIHSYLTYLRNRLLLARELLTESGSCFVQINDDNLHLVKIVMEEVFGSNNCVNIIPFKKRASFLSRFGKGLFELFDYIIWYAKDINKIRVNPLYVPINREEQLRGEFRYYEDENGIRTLTGEDIKNPDLCLSKVFRTHSASKKNKSPTYTEPILIDEVKLSPPSGHEWKADPNGMKRLKELNRLISKSPTRPYKIFYTDFPFQILNNLWEDTLAEQFPIYAVQTDELPIQRCLLLTTAPGDLVLDPTCGSGTTAYVAEQWGRRWITCDTSRVAITLAKQRLMTALYDYYELAHPDEGVGSGFNYKTVPHITLKSIANNEPPATETLYDQPFVDKFKKRVTGPFTLEAVPSQRVKSFEEVEQNQQEADITIARSGETLKQNEWIDKMLSAGIKGKGGQTLEFTRIASLGGTRWVHADAETKDGQKAVISFGPEYAPLEQRQVELAIEESQTLVPKPKIVIFASFQFDPEAAKDIDELKWPWVTILKAQMDTDILTGDLKKKPKDSPSFWLVGQPDIEIKKKGNKFVVEVNGFDYYNTKTGEIESGDISKIAMWELDTDYNGRSLYPRQVFFPMASSKEGWSKFSKNLKAQIDEELIEKYRGNVSLPFKLGSTKQIAVKIIDDRGIESLKIMKVTE